MHDKINHQVITGERQQNPEKNTRQRRAGLKRLFLLSEWNLLVYYPRGAETLRPGLDRVVEEALRLSRQHAGKRQNARLQTLQQIVDMVRIAGYEESGWAPFTEKVRLTLQIPAPGFWPAATALTTEFERYRASMPEMYGR